MKLLPGFLWWCSFRAPGLYARITVSGNPGNQEFPPPPLTSLEFLVNGTITDAEARGPKETCVHLLDGVQMGRAPPGEWV